MVVSGIRRLGSYEGAAARHVVVANSPGLLPSFRDPLGQTEATQNPHVGQT